MKPTKVLGISSINTDKSFEFTADLLAAIFTWGGVGWVLDRWLGTGPILMVIGFLVGNMAGIYLLYIRTRDGEPTSTDRAPTARTAHTDTTAPTDSGRP